MSVLAEVNPTDPERTTTVRDRQGSAHRRATLATLVMCATLATLTAPATALAAGKLYRWSEPDGALTFSPKPPADGTPYEEVDPTTMKPLDEAAAEDRNARIRTGTAAATPATKTIRAGATDDSDANESENTAPPLGRAVVQLPANGQAGPSGPSESSTGERPETSTELTRAQTKAGKPTGTPAQSVKVERCKELQKRVMSLERRLATPLTAVDMDNTVVHMARYQENYERHCR